MTKKYIVEESESCFYISDTIEQAREDAKNHNIKVIYSYDFEGIHGKIDDEYGKLSNKKIEEYVE
jgi:hypothetical protein